MSCCKADKRVNPYTKTGDKVERGKYKLLKWVLFIALCFVSPIFLIPMLYMVYVAIIREETINVVDMFMSVGKLIKTYKITRDKPDIDLEQLEVYEID